MRLTHRWSAGMKKIFLLLVVLLLTACATVKGAGKDLEKASDWTKEKMSK
jgi:predicted small secreted protein